MSQTTQRYGDVQQSYAQQYGSNNNQSQYEEKVEFNSTTEHTYPRENTFHRAGFGNGDFPNVPPNPLSKFLADFLSSVVYLSIDVSQRLYTNSSVIVIAAGLAGGVHHFASQYNPLANAALEAGFHGSVAVAKYVGMTFFIKTALTPIHESFTELTRENNDNISSLVIKHLINEMYPSKALKRKDLINSHVVSYLTPMALAWIVAYTQGIPVKLAAATLYTIGTFGVMKVLNRGYDWALAKYESRNR